MEGGAEDACQWLPSSETTMKTRVDFSAEVENEMKLTLPSLSVNEGMARSAVAAFCAQLNPTAVELADVKCAVSEAVTNCIVHAYRDTVGEISLTSMRWGSQRSAQAM